MKEKHFRHKIAVVICWFGDWPWYFEFFVHSVRYNKSIDFIIITDSPIIIPLPSNIRIINLSLSEIKVLAFQKLGFEVAIENAYKLCDFKPAYGLFFEDLLTGYDFWAHGDLDIILGNIRHFLTAELLDTYDVIALRHDYLTGYFTPYRNNTKLNNLFKISKHYRTVFANAKHFCFDETNFCFKQFSNQIHYSRVTGDVLNTAGIYNTSN